MTFKEATDLLGAAVTHEEIAAEAGVSVQSIRVARLDPASSNYRSPPAGWPKMLAKIARRRGKALEKLAVELDGIAKGSA